MIVVLYIDYNRYFIFKTTSREKKTDVQLLLEAEIEHDYLKEFKPKYIEKTIDAESVDNYVKRYMRIYGIDNVRGGTYDKKELTKDQRAFLTEELREKEDYVDALRELMETYAEQPLTKREIASKIEELKRNLRQYQKDKYELEQIKIDRPRETIRWVLENCQKQYDAFLDNKKNTYLYKLENKVVLREYRSAIQKLHKIYRIFRQITPHGISSHQNSDTRYPEFVLDDFFYHWHRIHMPDAMYRVSELCKAYEFFVTYIENRIAEREFDVASWDKYMEWKVPRAIYLLESMQV